MKKLIVNADDFGLSIETNRGIVEAFQRGILTSTTLFTNMVGFEDAVIQIKKNPDLGIGIHLNLTCGKPVSPVREVFQLVDSEGNFEKSLEKFSVKYYLKGINSKQIKTELKAQIEKFLDYGLEPTHIDTHQYIILFPRVYYIILDLMHKYKIRKLRFFQLNRSYFSDSFKRKCVKKAMIYLIQNKSKNNEFQTPDYIFDLENVTFNKRLYRVKDGLNEIICHPGYVDGEVKKIQELPIKGKQN